MPDLPLRPGWTLPLIARSVTSVISAFVFVGSVACHSGQPATYATNEGLRIKGTRPRVTHYQQASSYTRLTEFDNLEPGVYTATARRVGSQAQTARIVITRGFADTLYFNLGQP